MRDPHKSVILIVDDKSANIMALDGLLAAGDREVLHAASGEEALKILLNTAVDLVILDVQMPDMDGFEVANILKSGKRTRDIPIIFASAEKTEHRFMMKGFEEGAVDYLYKPLDPEIVKAKVAILLKIQLQKRELEEKNNGLTKSALLINNSADIIGVIDEATFTIEEINNAFTAILGYEKSEAEGLPLTAFLDEENRLELEVRKATGNTQLTFETSVKCKGGDFKWLQWNIMVRNGKWYANARDITGVREIERIRGYLATVVKQSNNAIYIVDRSGRIISWNDGAEKIYGYTEQEALQMEVWDLIPVNLHAECQTVIEGVTASEKIHELETIRTTKTGALIEVLFSANVINDNSATTNIAITERDITQQKLLDKQIKKLNIDLLNYVNQLENSNKELESFSYSISHDLRAPLRALNGYSRIMEEDYGKVLNDDARRLLGNIKYNSQKMGVLIDDLLDFSRLGRKEVRKAPVNMNDLVANVIAEMKSPGVELPPVEVETMPAINADGALIRQVWVNLISNAVKYSSKSREPQVKVGAEETDKEVTYYVQDNGAGFDMRYVDKLFGVFQRLHDSSEFEGTGIGLAIVQRVIAKHKGRAWARGTIGKGATFYFSLPK